MVNVSDKESFEKGTSETGRENTETVVCTSVLPLSVKCDNVDLIREVLDKDDMLNKTLRKTVILQKSQKSKTNFITEENLNPTFSSPNNIEFNNERNSSIDISRNSHLNFNSEIQTKNRIKEKSERRKFTCSKCGVEISSRAALTLHYNTKHLKNNNSNNDDSKIKKSQETVNSHVISFELFRHLYFHT